MGPAGKAILQSLESVGTERRVRAGDTRLAEKVSGVKRFQHRRFEDSYADLLKSNRYANATRFFLEDLYGPGDFSERDAQFARVVPALVKLFPKEIVHTVQQLAALHALSERLDSEMARLVAKAAPDAKMYAGAWQSVGQPESRERQIALMLEVGSALDRFTRKPLMRHSLRLMRGPAQAAGLGALQTFLEKGFDTFRAMGGAREFLDIIAARERAFVQALFDQDQ